RRQHHRQREGCELHAICNVVYLGAAAIFTALSAAGSVGISACPAGYLLELSTNESTSAYSSGLSEPGAFDGMSELIFANSAATVMSFQPLMKSGPESVGPAVSVPCSFGPWHVAQLSAYTFSPRLACASVKTPPSTDAGCWAPTDVYVTANRAEPRIRRTGGVIFMKLILLIGTRKPGVMA